MLELLKQILGASQQVLTKAVKWYLLLQLTFCNLQELQLLILTGKKHRQIKLQRLQKVGISTFGLLVHQISPVSLEIT